MGAAFSIAAVPAKWTFHLISRMLLRFVLNHRRRGYPSWRWGLSLISLTLAFHAAFVVMMGIVAVKTRARLETRSLDLWKLVPIMICIVTALGLLLAVALVIECGIWAAAYLWLGALDSPLDALLFSIDSMSTRGAQGSRCNDIGS